MKKSLILFVLFLLIVFTPFDLHSLDSLASNVNDARRTQFSACTSDNKIVGLLDNVTSGSPLVLTWPFMGKITEYNSNAQERTHKILLGYGDWWVNDEGLNSDGSENGSDHYCWRGYYVNAMSDCERLHSGIDINRKEDDSDNSGDDPDPHDYTSAKSVYPVFPGRVLTVGYYDDHWQHYVIVQHDSRRGTDYNFITIYAHLGSADVEQWQTVSLNTKIGSIADLKNDEVHDRDHLHFAIMMRATEGSGMDAISRGVITYGGGIDQASDSDNKYINASPLCLGVENDVVTWDDRTFFPDVPKGEWYYDYVLRLYQKGIVHGYPDGTFGPDIDVNKVELLKMAIEAMGASVSTCTSNPYDDVDKSEWYCPYVKYAKAQGWLDKFDDGDNFTPGNYAKRGWVAHILLQVKGGDQHCTDPDGFPFVDTNIGDYFISICGVEELGIFGGYPEKDCFGVKSTDGVYFCPHKFINRAETAKVIFKAIVEE